MISKHKKMSFVLTAVVFAMSTTWLLAAPVSHHFPNVNCGGTCNVDAASGNYGLALVLTTKGRVKTLERVPAIPIAAVAGTTGEAVAANVANAVCASAVAQGWVCGGCAPAAVAAAASAFACIKGGDGFSIAKAADTDGFGDIGTEVVFDKTGGPLEISSVLFYNAAVGNAHGPDLLRLVLAQVVTNGVNGSVTFRAFHTQGGANPRTFSVNTASFATSEALHAAIKTGLEGMGLGLTVDNLPPQVALSLSGDGSRFATGNFVVITNAAEKLTKIDVDGVPGQSLVTETGDPELIPTLSQWAMILLIGLMVGSGIWMLRRFPLGG